MQYFLGTRRIAERYLGSTLIYKHKEEEKEVIYTDRIISSNIPFTHDFDKVYSTLTDTEFKLNKTVPTLSSLEAKIFLDLTDFINYTVEVEWELHSTLITQSLTTRLENGATIGESLFSNDTSGRKAQTSKIVDNRTYSCLVFSSNNRMSNQPANQSIYSIKITGTRKPTIPDLDWIEDHCIKSSVPFTSNMELGFEKITDRWKSKAIAHSNYTRGYLELDTAGFTSYDVIIEASVSSENNYDFLTAYAKSTLSTAWDGTTDNVLKISGTVGKTTYMKTFPAESKFLHFFYRKDGSGSVGSDCGWIDSITIVGNK